MTEICGFLDWFYTNLFLQDKALSEMDKEDSPAESNDSDSEEAAVDREKALAEKEKVKHFWELCKVVKPETFMCETPCKQRLRLLSG